MKTELFKLIGGRYGFGYAVLKVMYKECGIIRKGTQVIFRSSDYNQTAQVVRNCREGNFDTSQLVTEPYSPKILKITTDDGTITRYLVKSPEDVDNYCFKVLKNVVDLEPETFEITTYEKPGEIYTEDDFKNMGKSSTVLSSMRNHNDSVARFKKEYHDIEVYCKATKVELKNPKENRWGFEILQDFKPLGYTVEIIDFD